ncbi:MAG: YceK/YidQ family lipoprotein, partial [Lachnospiraceae bacterium]|nr:YceK/YidQ family lipoprotein [Lachnospiraceae bacterium]
KSIQTANAVNSLSKDLISLIVSKVMTPAITPGGLSNFIPNLRDELAGLCDNLTNMTGNIHELCGVTTIDATEARQVINLCWVYLDGYERYANKNIDVFMYEKGRKAALYDKAVEAAEAYRDGFEERSKKSLEERVKQLSEPVKPVVPQTTDEDELLALADELKEGFEALDATFREDTKDRDGTLFSRLEEISYKGTRYDWSHPYYTGGAGIACFNLFVTDYPSSIDTLVFGYDLEHDLYNYQYLRDTGEDTFDKAIAQAEGCLDKLSAYETEAEGRYEAYLDTMLSYLAQFEGVRAALLTYDIEYNSFPTQAELQEKLEDYYKKCLTSEGKYVTYIPSQTEATIDDIRKVIEDYLEMLKAKKKEWIDFTETVDAALSDFHARYLEKQEDFEQTYQDMCRSLLECKRIYEDDTYKDYLRDLYKLNTYDHDQSDYAEAERRIAVIREECLKAHDSYDRERINAVVCNWRLENLLTQMKDMKGNLKGLDSGKVWLLNLMEGTQLKRIMDLSAELSEARNSEDYYLGGSNSCALYGFDNFGARMTYYSGYSYTEFSGMNSFELSLSGFYEEGVEMKPNYMRAEKETRDGMRDTLLNRINKETGYYSMGHYYNDDCRYLSYLYFDKSDYDGGSLQKGYYEIRNLFSDKIPGGYEYDLQNGLYEPVVKLSGPVSRNSDLNMMGDEMNPVTAEGDAALTADKELEIGEVWNLGSRIRLYPENATERTIVYESSDRDICTIDDNGVVTGTGNGVALVSVRALDSAWVKEEDGTITYTPAPLTYTVLVGTGVEDEGFTEETVYDEDAGICLKNYGTAENPCLYQETDNADGTKTIRMALNTVSPDLVYVAALYDAGGKLLRTRTLRGGYDTGWIPVSFTLKPENGLRLRLFALSENGFSPAGKVILDETIADGVPAGDAAFSYTLEDPDAGRSYVMLSIAGEYENVGSLPGLNEKSLYYIDQKLSETGEAISFSVRPKNTDAKQTVVLVSGGDGGESLIADPGAVQIVGHIDSTVPESGEKTTPPASDPVSG